LTSRWWVRASSENRDFGGLNRLFWLGTGLIFLQLVIGATMRHQHAGLAISDFPLAHHRVWPAMDPAAIAFYNSERMEVTAMKPITAFQIGLQMVHRMVALFVLGTVLWIFLAARRRLTWKAPLTKLSLVWTLLIFSQAALGAATIWSNKSADIATAHVAVGALSFMIGSMMILVARRSAETVPAASAGSSSAPAFRSGEQQGAPA
jgi:cytochrome c oxidase assembly protein subunit 15